MLIWIICVHFSSILLMHRSWVKTSKGHELYSAPSLNLHCVRADWSSPKRCSVKAHLMLGWGKRLTNMRQMISHCKMRWMVWSEAGINGVVKRISNVSCVWCLFCGLQNNLQVPGRQCPPDWNNKVSGRRRMMPSPAWSSFRNPTSSFHGRLLYSGKNNVYDLLLLILKYCFITPLKLEKLTSVQSRMTIFYLLTYLILIMALLVLFSLHILWNLISKMFHKHQISTT